MPRLVEETTGIGVNEREREFTNGVLDCCTNHCLGLFRIYVFVVTPYESGSIDKHQHDINAHTTDLWIGRL